MALIVSVVHSVAMISAGGSAAWLVYRYLGLQCLSRSWFNLDAVWEEQWEKNLLKVAMDNVKRQASPR